MLVKYKQNKRLAIGYWRNLSKIIFEVVEREGDTVKLKGKCENGTVWFEYADIDEIEEIK